MTTAFALAHLVTRIDMTSEIRFGAWVWDPNTLEMRNGSHVTALEPRVAHLFEFLFAHPGELLSHDRIVEAVWDGRVVSDEAVRRAVFSLRQALAIDGADSYIRTIRKKGYLAKFPAQTSDADNVHNAAIVHDAETEPLADAASVEPDPSEGAVQASAINTSRISLLLKVAGAAVLVLALATRFESVWERKSPAENDATLLASEPATLAVLPFVNLSEEPDTAFLADGLAEELLGSLARYRGLRVTARSSAFQFKGSNQDVRQVGQRLGVRYILEGSIRKSAENVRINARLIDTESSTQLWAETYDRTLEDWFALQQNVAEEVASALDFVLQPVDGKITQPGKASNVDAHLELLRARHLLATRSVADTEKAIEHLQRALTLEPGYALAYARLANAMLIQAESTTGIRAIRPTVGPLLDKAIDLDPTLGEAYALRSLLHDDPVAAERDLRQGLDLNPSYARGYELLAGLQARQLNKLELALHTIDRAIALDPLTPGNYYTKAGLLMWEGDWSGAGALYRRALDLSPEFRTAIVGLGTVSSLEGNFAEGINYTERAIALDPRADALREQLVSLYAAIGDLDAVRSINNPPTPFDQMATLWLEGNNEQLADTVYHWEPGEAVKIPAEFLSQIVLAQAASDQDYARALTFLSSVYGLESSLPPHAFGWQLYAYANLVQLLAASGNADAAKRLLEQINTRMDTIELQFPRHAKLYSHVRAILLAHAGLSEAACAAFESGATPNPGPRWRIVAEHTAFDKMRTAPCFTTLLDRIETHNASERVRLDAMRRAGQVPDRSAATSRSGNSAAAT